MGMVKIVVALHILMFQQLSYAATVVCSKEKIRRANRDVIRLFAQEAWRFAKIRAGLYPQWTGPYDQNLLQVCHSAQNAAEKAGEGSAIFIGLDSDLYQILARSTNSWVSHTGLLFKQNGSWVVYESKAPQGPSKPTPMCDFIRRSTGYRFALTRARSELSSQQIQALRDFVSRESLHGYDFSFDIANEKTQFCSKLTYNAYRNIGLEFGQVQSLQQILDEYEGPPQEQQNLGCFWMAWTGGAKIFSQHELSVFDWNQATITPASQYKQAVDGLRDRHAPFVLVFDSHDFD